MIKPYHCSRCGAFLSPWPYEEQDNEVGHVVAYEKCARCGYYRELGRDRAPRYPYPASAGWPR